MRLERFCTRRLLLCWAALIVALQMQGICADRVQFNREIRPILAEHCWQCHGPDRQARKSGLRLDVREYAVKPAESGANSIVPGSPDASELMRRITSSDLNERMPPADTHERLSPTQISTLRKWIEQGAEYEQHWAFRPIARPSVPQVDGVEHPIDAFVVARLTPLGRSLAGEASRERLLRRLTLTLTGLPPTPNNLRSDLNSSYNRVVDRLLASPHFGEHLAVGWLDAARYADTNGYFGDKPRQMWLWRNWVIDAFNSNMPFDQFTIEQLAGDLLPNPTIRQRIATGFNRNHMANNETGIIDEEYRVEYVVDRVDTTLTTWMGLTVGCAQCHDHKYDPISQRDFYRLFAFFNNGPGKGLITAENPPPLMSVPSLDQKRRLAELQSAAAVARQEFAQLKSQLDDGVAAWEADAEKLLPSIPDTNVVLHEPFDDGIVKQARRLGTDLAFERGVQGQAARFDATQHVEHPLDGFDVDAPWSIGFWIKPDGTLSCLLSKIEPEGRRRGTEVLLQKGRVRVNLVEHWGVRTIEATVEQRLASRQWHHVVVTYDGSRSADGLRVLINGTPRTINVVRDTLSGNQKHQRGTRAVSGRSSMPLADAPGDSSRAAGSCANKEPLRIGRRDSGLGYYGAVDEIRILQRQVSDDVVAGWYRGERLRGILATDAASRSPVEREFLLDDYITHHTNGMIKAARRRIKQTAQAEREFRTALPTTLVMQDLAEPRSTHVLIRGQYDRPGDVVQPGVPESIGRLPADAPRNRLGLAGWLVSNQNPLTARVAVNRVWKHCFGHGLVRTMNNFGTQGEPPTHPELLDWLAAEFLESGWDVKQLLRLIVSSQTFRQESRRQGDASFDPQNRLWSRGPSYRMTAEMIRDQALAVSGLLRRRIGGPSVKPYQPAGLWEEVSYNGEETYEPDTGDGLWRRSLYTWIKRQAPPPAFQAFDGATREKCTIQRDVTNTPLQSLILLNDPVFVEAARGLAAQVLFEQRGEAESTKTTVVTETATTSQVLNRLFQRVLSRKPDDEERQLLLGLLQRQLNRLRKKPDAAAALLSVGKAPPIAHLDRIDVAAWTVVALTVLNLDEAINVR